jgi:hypothetical protein
MFGPQVVVLFDIPLRENSGILAVRSAAWTATTCSGGTGRSSAYLILPG